MLMDFRQLEQIVPKLHRDCFGQEAGWYVAEMVADFILNHVTSDMNTLETGAGLSTIIFAQLGSRHTSIVSDPEESERILSFCQSKQISCEGLNFVFGLSEKVLPQVQLADLDLVLIDGGHGFPTPFIDWYYTQKSLKVGGFMLIDDTQIWTGATLSQFLAEEPSWKRVDSWPYRACVYQKIADSEDYMDWVKQPFVEKRSLNNPDLNYQLSKEIAKAALLPEV